jgi:hypothetical protein
VAALSAEQDCLHTSFKEPHLSSTDPHPSSRDTSTRDPRPIPRNSRLKSRFASQNNYALTLCWYNDSFEARA